jgi:pimeloyl-ACP methyl ester carboxylesterase
MSPERSPVELDVDATGSGPTIVFSHGWLDDRSAWAGVAASLSDDYRCVSWSLRGHGDSGTPPPGNYSRAHALDDLRSIVASADAPVVLAGHSLGGYLSLAYAIDNPDQVAALILVAAGPGFRKADARQQWNASVDASAAKAGPPEGSEVISKHFDSWVIDNLAEITAPTLVVVGEGDKPFMASAAVFEKRMDVRQTVIVPEAGHNVHRSKADSVAMAIRDFLAAL